MGESVAIDRDDFSLTRVRNGEQIPFFECIDLGGGMTVIVHDQNRNQFAAVILTDREVARFQKWLKAQQEQQDGK